MVKQPAQTCKLIVSNDWLLWNNIWIGKHINGFNYWTKKIGNTCVEVHNNLEEKKIAYTKFDLSYPQLKD